MRRYLVVSGAATALLLPSIAGHAVTFANFQWYTATKPKPGVIVNPGNTLKLTATSATNGTFAITTGATPVEFFFDHFDQYANTLPGGYNGDLIDAKLTFTGLSDGNARLSGTSHLQDFQKILFTFTSVSDAHNTAIGIAGGKNLLTGKSGNKQKPDGSPSPLSNGVGGTLSGVLGTHNPDFNGADTNGSPLFDNAVIYSSDYINFTGALEKAYSWAFSNVKPAYAQTGVGPGSFIKGFTAEASGRFDAAFVPEPGSCALLGSLVLAGVGLLRRRGAAR